MATNLRLRQETAKALQDAARATGRSQQDLLREAVDRFLGLGPVATEAERLIASGALKPPTPFQDVEPWLITPPGLTSLDLLDRDSDC